MSEFRKSSQSLNNGTCVEVAFRRASGCSGGNCVEVGFRRSTKCADGQCVEVDLATVRPNVLLRDSKSERRPFEFSPDEWAAFVAAVKDGEFDLPA